MMHLKSDDICPNGFNCTIPFSGCRRIHTAISEHMCTQPLNFASMRCDDMTCQLMHMERTKVRDMIASVILSIYSGRCQRDPNYGRLRNIEICGDELVATYLAVFGYSPIPGITGRQWRRLIRSHAWHFHDHIQQDRARDFTKSSVLTLWTVCSAPNRIGFAVRLLRDNFFFANRACQNAMYGIECAQLFCAYFHFDLKCVEILENCQHCANVQCDRFHIEDRRVRCV